MYSSERLKGLDVFVTVADMGSFASAAERLNLTASAVSKSVARLESRLGARLFQRTTRRLSLTEAGLTFYRTCTAVLSDLEEAELTLATEHNEPQGKIRIDLPASFGRLHALPLILDFVRAHPQLLPHISFSDHFVDPVQQGIDIVVRIGGPDSWPAALGHHFLGAQRLIMCASPAYLAGHGVPLNEQDLEHHHCIAYAHTDGLVAPWYFKGRQPGEMERRTLQPRIAVGDGEGEVIATLAGHGIAQLPTWLVQGHLQEGRLLEVLPELATDGLPMNIVWLKNREGLAKVSALLAHLKQHLAPDGRID
ncbi:LysR substrate-binding domain-containing protein [Pseudomonas sp. 3A(2025)]